MTRYKGGPTTARYSEMQGPIAGTPVQCGVPSQSVVLKCGVSLWRGLLKCGVPARRCENRLSQVQFALSVVRIPHIAQSCPNGNILHSAGNPTVQCCRNRYDDASNRRERHHFEVLLRGWDIKHGPVCGDGVGAGG